MVRSRIDLSRKGASGKVVVGIECLLFIAKKGDRKAEAPGKV
jgi:hypothetical protein